MVTPYDLPIPFHDYAYACAGMIVLTFAVLLVVPPGARAAASVGPAWRVPKALVRALRTAAIVLLAFAIVAGLLGAQSPISNPAPFLVWTALMLGLTLATVVIGDVFALANPWHALARLLGLGNRPRLPYPAWLGHWPALASYLGLAWLELMAPPLPWLLAATLAGYTAVSLAGAALFGRLAWFGQAELFGHFFRSVGTMAPLTWRNEGGDWIICRRPALSGRYDDMAVNQAGSSRLATILFILFMLAATTYDGVWQTSFWAEIYWHNLMHWLQPLWHGDYRRAQDMLAPGYAIYQRGGLFAAPIAYLLVFLPVVALTRALSHRRVGLLELADRFAPSLIPIAVGYMIAHNWTAILSSFPVVPFLVTDPFGLGWNLIGLPPLMAAEPPPLDMGRVWHTEVILILAGHVASVYAARQVELASFPITKQAWVAELPILVLMVGYTFVGLIVLSLPLALH
ncbi:MAG: hypothetical protein ACRYHQ_18580 [Janthinobacterium lividum]